MKRLVYNPRVDVYVKCDDGIFDLSSYVVGCSVDRKINQVSSASVTFRNPGFIFTEHRYRDPLSGKDSIGPMFHPQDPIIIALTRLRDRPIQVFTGYCDTTPYLQLFPGLATIEASCTLKRLMYTYWDPGLPFVWDWLMAHGWQVNQAMGGLTNYRKEMQPLQDANLTDGSFGRLLFDLLKDIGNWPEKAIYIEKLPPQLLDLITNLFEEFKQDSETSSEEFETLMRKLMGGSTLGGGAPGGTGTGTGSGAPPGAKVSPEQVAESMLAAGFPCDAQIIANGLQTMSGESGFGTTSGWDVPHDGGVRTA